MSSGRSLPVLAWLAVAVLLAVVMVFAAIRMLTDIPYLLQGGLPPTDDFAYRYVTDFVLAYAHIVPGVVYLAGAPLQLWRGFRNRHLTVHRRLGRVLLVSGLVSGVFAIVFAILHAFGGWLEAAASVVFGVYFLTALLLAYRSIRSSDRVAHRRWMIRAFAIALGVGTIRLWIGLFQAAGLLTLRESFGPAFWLAFLIHAGAAELWLRRRPV